MFESVQREDDVFTPLRKKCLEILSNRNESFDIPPPVRKRGEIEVPFSVEYSLVFIDGFFSIENSKLPPDVVCLPLDAAMQTYGVFLQKKFAQGEENPHALLNGALQGLGAFLYVPPNRKVLETIHIDHFFTGSNACYPRLFISLGKNAEAKIKQRFNQEGFANAFMDVTLDALSHLEMKVSQEKTELVQSYRASLKRDCSFTLRQSLVGSSDAKQSIIVELLQENAAVLLEGITKLENKRNAIDVLVKHLAPYTRSRQHFKALLNGKSKASFKGTIFVDPIAQKTEGYQLSNNLLLSPESTAYVQPNLEIFADDVKASHGATVTQLDREALFYLLSRGLSDVAAKEFLVKGFLQELSECHS